MFIGSLRKYQQDAVDRMVERGQMMLAMTMGAGKTPTTLGAIEQMYEEGDIDRALIVVPASLKLQWRDEIKKFTNGRTMVIDGTKKKRERQWRTSGDARYVIVNPETLLNDYKLIGQIQAIVIDESTIIKNRSAKRSKLMKRLGKTVPFRFALTGQPIENRPEELFCADDQTQVLSQRGWLAHGDLTTHEFHQASADRQPKSGSAVAS